MLTNQYLITLRPEKKKEKKMSNENLYIYKTKSLGPGEWKTSSSRLVLCRVGGRFFLLFFIESFIVYCWGKRGESQPARQFKHI